MSPKFSIVIPTRDRKETLGPCIAGCLLQTHGSYELVVQDNASTDGTAELMGGISDSRVSYFRSPNRLSMRSNFEAALANAKGEYVIMIGDDDGIVPGALDRLDKLLTRGKIDFVSWPTLYYFWPGFDPRGIDFGVALKRGNVFGANRLVTGNNLTHDFVSATSIHFRLVPKIYHGCASRRAIDAIRRKTGNVFNYDIPDLYFQVASSMLGGQVLSMLHPVSIIGGSPRSTGGGQFGNTSGELNENTDTSFGRFMQEASLDAPALVPFNPHFTSIDYFTYASLVIAAAAFKPDLQIAHDAWVRRVVKQLSQNPALLRIAKRAPALSELDQRLVDALKAVPDPTINPAAAPTASLQPPKPKPLKLGKALSKCRLLTEIDGTDNVLTATQVLASAFAGRHSEMTTFPGWQALQLVRWGQMLAATKDRVVS